MLSITTYYIHSNIGLSQVMKDLNTQIDIFIEIVNFVDTF